MRSRASFPRRRFSNDETCGDSEGVGRGAAPFRKPEPLRLSQWAAKHFYLCAESSYDEQPFSAYPYQVGILDAIGDDAIEEIVVAKSARIGFTKIALASIAYFAEHKRRNQAIWNPTDEDSDEFVKGEFEPIIRDVPAMAQVFPGVPTPSQSQHAAPETFPRFDAASARRHAAKNYRRLSIAIAFLDEFDAFDPTSRPRAPPSSCEEAVEGATFPKIVLGSTPKIRGLSMIESRLALAEKQFRSTFIVRIATPSRRFASASVDCELRVQMDRARSRDGRASVRVTAERSSSRPNTWPAGSVVGGSPRWNVDRPRGQIPRRGRRAVPPPRSVGFHIWTAYSPQTDWAAIVRQFLSATKRLEAGDKVGIEDLQKYDFGRMLGGGA